MKECGFIQKQRMKEEHSCGLVTQRKQMRIKTQNKQVKEQPMGCEEGDEKI